MADLLNNFEPEYPPEDIVAYTDIRCPECERAVRIDIARERDYSGTKLDTIEYPLEVECACGCCFETKFEQDGSCKIRVQPFDLRDIQARRSSDESQRIKDDKLPAM